MTYDIKILRDNINSQFVFLRNDVTLLTIPFSYPWTELEVSIDTEFSVWIENTTMYLAYLGTPETDIQNFKIDVSSYFDIPLPDTCGFTVVNSTWDNEFFFVIKNQFGTFSSLIENGMTFNSEFLTVTGVNYVEGEILPTSCDLSVIAPEFDEIDLALASLDEKVNSAHQKLDYLVTVLGQVYTLEQTLSTKADLGLITFDTSALATKDDIANIVLPSLNGNGSEYKDGTSVTIFGRSTVYTVERSYMSLYSDNGYTVHYDLISVDGYRCSVPEALLTKYVEAV